MHLNMLHIFQEQNIWATKGYKKKLILTPPKKPSKKHLKEFLKETILHVLKNQYIVYKTLNEIVSSVIITAIITMNPTDVFGLQCIFYAKCQSY